jgi:NAD-dependent deacetylase
MRASVTGLVHMEPLRIESWRQIVFFIGAGMSAESGVPTYRGRGGIWQQYDYTQYACQRAFDRDPEKVLDFHELRRTRVLACPPHAGHSHLARLQQAWPPVAIITQNIDGLLQRAGLAVAAELHGSLWRVRCRCGTCDDAGAGRFRERRCPRCGQWLRPDITWFEDPVDESVFEHAARIVAAADLFVSIGTSGEVWPAARFVRQAQLAGARMVEINPEETKGSVYFRDCIRAPASVAIPEHFPLPRP